MLTDRVMNLILSLHQLRKLVRRPRTQCSDKETQSWQHFYPTYWGGVNGQDFLNSTFSRNIKSARLNPVDKIIYHILSYLLFLVRIMV